MQSNNAFSIPVLSDRFAVFERQGAASQRSLIDCFPALQQMLTQDRWLNTPARDSKYHVAVAAAPTSNRRRSAEVRADAAAWRPGRAESAAAVTRSATHRRVTEGGLAAVLEDSPALASLQLYWNLKVRDATLRTLAARCPALAGLSLSGCKGVTDAGLAALAGGCRQLADLDLTRWAAVCWVIHDS